MSNDLKAHDRAHQYVFDALKYLPPMSALIIIIEQALEQAAQRGRVNQALRICFKKVVQTFLKSKTRKPEVFVFFGKQNLGDFTFRSALPCAETEVVSKEVLKQLLKGA